VDNINNVADFTELIFQKRVLLFTWNLMQREYPYHVASIAQLADTAGAKLKLVVANQLSQRETEHYNTSLFLEKLTNAHGTETELIATSLRDLQKYKDVPGVRNLQELKKQDPELYRSILSSWLSKNLITLDEDLTDKKLLNLLTQDLAEYEFWLSRSAEIIQQFSGEVVIIMNGRHHTNVATRRSAEVLDQDYLFFESGIPKLERIFLQRWQPQDVTNYRVHYAESAQLLNESERFSAIEWAKDWLQKNRSDVKVNPFIHFQTQKASLTSRGVSYIPIFTSSTNEFFSNLNHPLNGWNYPDEGVIEVAKRIKVLGYRPIVRIHPNAGWKAMKELLFTLQRLLDNEIGYILPWAEASSYDLLSKADFFVTWSSTLALEGTAMGLKGYTLGYTHYDVVAGVESISREALVSWNPIEGVSPSRNNALLQIYLQNNYGIPVRRQEWVEETKLPSRKKNTIKRIWINTRLFCQAARKPLESRPYDIYIFLSKCIGPKNADKVMRAFLETLLKTFTEDRK
jgi:hypothetical protein